jgi:hypothetical protein
VEIGRGEKHGVLANVLQKQRDELLAGLATEEHAATLDVLTGFS